MVPEKCFCMDESPQGPNLVFPHGILRNKIFSLVSSDQTHEVGLEGAGRRRWRINDKTINPAYDVHHDLNNPNS